MSVNFDGKLVVAISSSALFDLSESHEIYLSQGLDAYRDYQIDQEDKVLAEGDAFPLVKKLLALNAHFDGDSKVEVILLSRNSSDTGLRVFNSIEHYHLPITRAAFTGGSSPYQYVSAFGAHLFLSTNVEDVKNALSAGLAAASIWSGPTKDDPSKQLRIAFDGDAVLFSDESERVFKTSGLDAFTKNEKAFAHQPLSGGPFKAFLEALHNLQSHFPEEESPIRTALVTARSAPAHERVIRTLREWDIRIDESLFLGGLDKADFLRAFQADFFFDDQQGHIESASKHVATGHVPHGVANESAEMDMFEAED